MVRIMFIFRCLFPSISLHFGSSCVSPPSVPLTSPPVSLCLYSSFGLLSVALTLSLQLGLLSSVSFQYLFLSASSLCIFHTVHLSVSLLPSLSLFGFLSPPVYVFVPLSLSFCLFPSVSIPLYFPLSLFATFVSFPHLIPSVSPMSLCLFFASFHITLLLYFSHLSVPFYTPLSFPLYIWSSVSFGPSVSSCPVPDVSFLLCPLESLSPQVDVPSGCCPLRLLSPLSRDSLTKFFNSHFVIDRLIPSPLLGI